MEVRLTVPLPQSSFYGFPYEIVEAVFGQRSVEIVPVPFRQNVGVDTGLLTGEQHSFLEADSKVGEGAKVFFHAIIIAVFARKRKGGKPSSEGRETALTGKVVRGQEDWTRVL